MIRAGLLLLALALPLRAEVLPALHDVTGVAADDVLNIRAAPDAAAEVIGTLTPDETAVEVISVTEGWALVNTGEGSGYASMRFLTRQDGPDWNALQTPLTCVGTEPFWSLKIDPDVGTANMVTPDDLDGYSMEINQTWRAEPGAPAAALSVPEGLIVLRPAECSDGMSERRFGIAVDVFLTRPDKLRLSGCCRLGQP